MTHPFSWLDHSLDTLHRANWYRSVKTVESAPGPEIILQGQTLINFASNDYLGLANHPRLKQAAIQAIEAWGTGSTGSRLLSGHRALHAQLETAIADWKQTEAALVFSSGYLANLGTITALVGPKDGIFSDEYNHSSLKNGAKLSGARIFTYRHGDDEHLEQLLKEYRSEVRRCLILTDSVFSMDGDLCPLPQLITLAETWNGMLLIDEAHATGVLGETGAGCREHFKIHSDHLIQMGTLSKALGSLGGYVAGSQTLIQYLINRSATWVYTTALSPADTAAALEAIAVIQSEPQHLYNLWANIADLREQLAPLHLPLLPSESPIICLGMKTPEQVLSFSQKLQEQGIFAPAIRPPTVPTSRLRFSVMANHTQTQLAKVGQVLSQLTLEAL